MLEFFQRMIALDSNSLTLVIMICGWGFLIMRSMMPIAGVAVAAFPLLVFSSLAAHAILRDTGYIVHLERGAGLAVSTGVGMTFALLLVVILVRIWLAVHDATRSRPEQMQGQN